MKNYSNVIQEQTTLIPKRVLEIGSRDGIDPHILSNIFGISEDNIFIIEPHPKSFLSICETYPNSKNYNLALFNKNEDREFIMLERDVGISSLLGRVDSFYERTPHQKIKVECLRGDTFLQKNKLETLSFDLCKLDVEGATYQVLEGFGNLLTQIKSFHLECEYKEIWKDQAVYSQIKELMTSKGYTLLYEENLSNMNVQSDSIWVLNEYVNHENK
tara:strand:- start:787 stop:1434 length:648 start_codon:yes stop_codon:yes gene_type:complete